MEEIKTGGVKKWVWIVVIIIIIILAVVLTNKPKNTSAVKIGVITDLTGPAAYWGESTKAGADILLKELTAEGQKVEFVFEDYGLDAAKSISAAQKLVNINNVDAVYAEFNPAAIAVSSFLKDKQIPFIYDAAVVSPLKDNNLFYKTYLDYQEGCKQIAQKFKDNGVVKMGMLKMNLEAGELCYNGIKEVYGGNLISEGFNLGETDFRTQLLKIKNGGAGAVITSAFEGDTANTLKVIKDFKYDLLYGTVDDTITDNVKNTYGAQLNGALTFGFSDPSADFQAKLKDYKLATPYGAAIAYTHLKQLVKAVSDCGKDTVCISKSLNNSKTDQAIGFQGYKDRIANLIMKIKQY